MCKKDAQGFAINICFNHGTFVNRYFLLVDTFQLQGSKRIISPVQVVVAEYFAEPFLFKKQPLFGEGSFVVFLYLLQAVLPKLFAITKINIVVVLLKVIV